MRRGRGPRTRTLTPHPTHKPHTTTATATATATARHREHDQHSRRATPRTAPGRSAANIGRMAPQPGLSSANRPWERLQSAQPRQGQAAASTASPPPPQQSSCRPRQSRQPCPETHFLLLTPPLAPPPLSCHRPIALPPPHCFAAAPPCRSTGRGLPRPAPALTKRPGPRRPASARSKTRRWGLVACPSHPASDARGAATAAAAPFGDPRHANP